MIEQITENINTLRQDLFNLIVSMNGSEPDSGDTVKKQFEDIKAAVKIIEQQIKEYYS